MIATLNGVVAEQQSDGLVLDVGGVGYGLLMTGEDAGKVTCGEPLKIYVYEYIREQNHDLYGFCTLETKQLFTQLLDVSGVGPKMALSLLNLGTAASIKNAIATGNTKFISQASGVGKRLAERLVVELKDKVGLSGVDLAGSNLMKSEQLLLQDEAAQALVALGYSPVDATAALVGIEPLLPTSERLKLALKVSHHGH